MVTNDLEWVNSARRKECSKETLSLKLLHRSDSFGWAVQAGVDIPVGNNWLINLDVKKVKIGVDVKADVDGTGVKKIGDFNVDPLLFSVGVGYRF